MNQKNTIRIAFIRAGWHAEIVNQAFEGFVSTIEDQLPEAAIDIYDVPGSLEIPLQSQQLARSGNYQVIVAAGLIVDGGIYRHDFVAQSVLDGMMRVQLDCSVPILSVVLTPHHFQDTDQHREFFFEHFKLKGVEAAHACLGVLDNRKRLSRVA
jgi:6,7-dimethyl-8-ribityllumazine synthase